MNKFYKDKDTNETKENVPLFQFLIIDQTDFMRETLKKIIKYPFGNDTAVYEASNFIEGLEQYKKYHSTTNPIDIIFINLTIKERDGMELTKELLSIDSNACIFICSSLYSEKIQKDVFLSGAKAFIKKPYDEKEVLTKISNMIQKDNHF